MWIKDNETGTLHQYGQNQHDSLVISDDGKYLSYENLQNGDGSIGGGYSFVTDERGAIPKNDEDLLAYGASAYFNIGGFGDDVLKAELRRVRRNYLDSAFKKGGIEAETIAHHAYEQAKADIIQTIEAKRACMITHGIEQYKIDGLDALKAIVEHTEQGGRMAQGDTETGEW